MIPRYDFKRVVKHKVTLKGKNVCGTHINMNGKGTLRASAMACRGLGLAPWCLHGANNDL